MDQRLKDYIEYYRSRMRKYENNPVFTNSFASEKHIFEAISSCETLDEFKTKLEDGNLLLKNAVALTKDQEIARKELYENIKEFVRKKAPDQILEMLADVETVNDLTKKANEIGAKVSIEISIDQMTSYFYYDFTALENMEVWENAEIPEEWHKEIHKEWVQETIEEGRKIWQNTILPESHKWSRDWKFNFDLIWEDRHRRLIPVPDETVGKRIEQFKTYRGI
jgi:hypothetical protein